MSGKWCVTCEVGLMYMAVEVGGSPLFVDALGLQLLRHGVFFRDGAVRN